MLSLDTQQVARHSTVYIELYRNSTCKFEFISQSALTTPRRSFESIFQASVAQEYLYDLGHVDGEVDIIEDRGCRDGACNIVCRILKRKGGSCVAGSCKCKR
ncbi:hypothetical protein NPIL_542181 [Nephila pilipes]|uniref:Uncharacterized protein n=1 Tax=Nephila pilipes TaxID=299642 RepID=A0A8X6T012_NEPPI|nr:hypothetical protein NPIL_542181 [Nephila pilipes]